MAYTEPSFRPGIRTRQGRTAGDLCRQDGRVPLCRQLMAAIREVRRGLLQQAVRPGCCPVRHDRSASPRARASEMAWFSQTVRRLFGASPVHEAAGRGRRSLAWMPGNPGAVAAMLATNARTARQEPGPRSAQCLGAGRYRSLRGQCGRHRHQTAKPVWRRTRSRPRCRHCGATGRGSRRRRTDRLLWPAGPGVSGRCSKAANA